MTGVRVIDLTSYLAGPYGCALLGDLGADVIKVEPPAGDMMRSYPTTLLGEQAAHILALTRTSADSSSILSIQRVTLCFAASPLTPMYSFTTFVLAWHPASESIMKLYVPSIRG